MRSPSFNTVSLVVDQIAALVKKAIAKVTDTIHKQHHLPNVLSTFAKR